jgi:hypothetical protein
MATEDTRFAAVQALIENGKIHSFRAIFDIIPKSFMAAELSQNYRTFTAKLENLRKFTIGDLDDMGKIMGVSPIRLSELLMSELPKRKVKGAGA